MLEEAAFIHNKNGSAIVGMAGNVILDVDDSQQQRQQSERCCSGSPTVTRSLTRKGSNCMERRCSDIEQESDDINKKLVIKVVPSQMEQLKVPLMQSKMAVTPQSGVGTPLLSDSAEGRNKRFHRLSAIHPRKIVLFFATVSSVGSMILIYFTIAIRRKSQANDLLWGQ